MHQYCNEDQKELCLLADPKRCFHHSVLILGLFEQKNPICTP